MSEHRVPVQAGTTYRLTARVVLTGRAQVWKPMPRLRTARVSRIRQAYARRRR